MSKKENIQLAMDVDLIGVEAIRFREILLKSLTHRQTLELSYFLSRYNEFVVDKLKKLPFKIKRLK